MRKQRIISLFVVAALLFALMAGCAEKLTTESQKSDEKTNVDKIDSTIENNQQTPISEPEDPPSEESIAEEPPVAEEPVDISELVSDAYSYTYTYEGNEPEYHVGEVGYEYHIPQINIDSEEVNAINKEIWEQLYDEGMSTVLECISLGTSVYITSISYDCAVNDDILSLYTKICYHDGSNYHLVYNISVSTGSVVSTQDLLSYAGFTEEAYLEAAKQSIGSYFLSYYAYDPAEKAEFIKYHRVFLEKTLQDDSIKQARPFMNDKGELCLITKMYSSAGAEYYERLCNLESFELLPYQDILADPHSGYDPVLAELYADYDISVSHTFHDMDNDGIRYRYSQ